MGVVIDRLASVLCSMYEGADHIVQQAHPDMLHLGEPLSRKSRLCWRHLVALMSALETHSM